MVSRCLLLCALILGVVASTLAASKVERISPPPATGVSEALHQAVDAKGYRVTLDDGWTAEFWLARQLKSEKKDVPGALYPELTNAEFVGIVRFPQGFSDYRGQSLPAGVYTLRYQLLPQDGNHMGVAPNPDFLLASPASDDSRPEQSYVYRKLVAVSAKSTSTGHPAVIALESAGEPGNVTKQDNGNVILSVGIPAADGSTVKLGVVVKGVGAQ
jgi:hypothetical protein